MEKIDIFISYRRDGGEGVAGRISDKFSSKGYKTFYDVESLRAGKFNEQIFDAIDACRDLLVVLPPNGLDRCNNENDWVRLEIAYAIKKNKNIIPVFLRNFEFPKVIPDEISGLRLMQGVSASNEYFDATITRIENLLTCKKNPEALPQNEIKFDGKIKIPFFMRTPVPDEKSRGLWYDDCKTGHFLWNVINSGKYEIPDDRDEAELYLAQIMGENHYDIHMCANYCSYYCDHLKNINDIYLVPKRYKEDEINPQELMHEVSDLAQTCFYNWDISSSEVYINEFKILGKSLMGSYSRKRDFCFEIVPDFCMQCFTLLDGVNCFMKYFDDKQPMIKRVLFIIYDSVSDYGVYEDAAIILNNRVKLFLKYFQLISMFLDPAISGKKVRKFLLINYKYMRKHKVVLTKENEELFEKLVNIFGKL